jgi:membrane fusion protein, copper/silver efflux system
MNSPLKLFISLLLFSGCSSPDKKGDEHSGMNMSDMVHLDARQKELINLKIDTVRMKPISETISFVGIATINENSVTTLSSKVNGRIDKLFVRNPGEEVETGEPLYSIYSEELLSNESEFLLALQQDSQFTSAVSKSLVESSRNSLLQWGLTVRQLTELSSGKKASPYITFYSAVKGFVAELNVSEGQYVSIGTPLFKISSLKTVWVSAEIYQHENSALSNEPEVQIQFSGFLPVTGKVIQNSPVITPGKNISMLIIEVQNIEGKIKPGMMATVSLKSQGKETLVIPKSSLVLGKMASVWIETKPGMFENRMIETGLETKTEVEVTSGLNEGELVVSNGNYLLNSQYILQNGAGSMHGMHN